jgi:hypothetical protein
MRAVTATAIVRADHILTVPLPADIPPGVRNVVVVLEDEGAGHQGPVPLMFTPHDTGPTDPTCTFRREDLYGDDGR